MRRALEVARQTPAGDIPVGAVLLGDKLVLRQGGEEITLVTTAELGIKGAHNVENAQRQVETMHIATVGAGAHVSNTSGPSSAAANVKRTATRTITTAPQRKNDADGVGVGKSFQNG